MLKPFLTAVRADLLSTQPKYKALHWLDTPIRQQVSDDIDAVLSAYGEQWAVKLFKEYEERHPEARLVQIAELGTKQGRDEEGKEEKADC